MSREDLKGQKLGKLTVLEEGKSVTVTGPKNTRTHTTWKCQCECGNIKEIRSCYLKKGYNLSCGCLGKTIKDPNKKSMKDYGNKENLIGMKFGKLLITAIGIPIPRNNGKIHNTFVCKCDCGTIKTIKASNIIADGLKSCGCFNYK